MADRLLIDISYARPVPADIKASGYAGVIGYVSPEVDKNLPAPYIAQLHAEGLGVLLIWESTAQSALGGAGQGTVDAGAAFNQVDALGYEGPVFFNVGDFAAEPNQFVAITAYCKAIENVANGRPLGGYATGAIIDNLWAMGVRWTFWQNAMNDAGQEGSVVSVHSSLYQRVQPTMPAIPGGGYDEDVEVNGATVPLWGSVPGPTPEPAPTPEPPSDLKEEEMTSIVVGGQLHIFAVINGVVSHWWQELGPPASAWHGPEQLPG